MRTLAGVIRCCVAAKLALPTTTPSTVFRARREYRFFPGAVVPPLSPSAQGTPPPAAHYPAHSCPSPPAASPLVRTASTVQPSLSVHRSRAMALAQVPFHTAFAPIPLLATSRRLPATISRRAASGQESPLRREPSAHGRLSSLGSLSPSPLVREPPLLPASTPAPPQRRGFRVLPPVRMGRRSSKIATRKNAQDAKRAKQYGKLGKQIVSAVKQGGPNPGSNPALAAALTSARQIGAPKELIDRNIKKASEKGQAEYQEIVYEVYGLGGVGIVVEALSDNNARAAATVRDVVKKGGGKMADPGSVLFNFKRCGVVAVPADSADGDELLEAAMDAGADDVLEPQEEEEEGEPSVFRVVASPESYLAVRAALEQANVPINSELSGLELIPVAFVEPDDEALGQNELMMMKLLDLDDVDAVFSNQKH